MNVVVETRSNHFPAIARRAPQLAHDLVGRTAHQIEAIIKVGMAEPKTGNMYGNHQASAPGDMPAMDTGNLANSIMVEFEEPTIAVVYTNVDYSAHLEFGTMRMAPRPFMTPAAEAVRPEFEAEAARIRSSLR